ncbi:hypothetical protein [Mangrovimicrobium sediminis]|nr:hypothetical protein [Haliea sp. SAOS-164]
MYYWLRDKLGGGWLPRLLAIAVYTLMMLLILIYSVFPSDSFRYLEI